MMLRGWRQSVPLQASVVTLAIAAGVNAWALTRALRVPPLPESPPAAIAGLETMQAGSARKPKTDIEAAVDNNVFSSDRSAPAAPYRMPGEPDPNARPVAQPDKPLVLGTAVATDGRHFATVQMRDGSPKLVYVGDKIGEWTVRAIERGKVTLLSTGGIRAEVIVPKPGS